MKTAKQRYDELEVDKEETDPLERLRAFCSLAMSGEDWLDVEPFFDAVKAQRDTGLKDHEIAQVVTKLRDIAKEFHATQQLRDRIGNVIVPALKAAHENAARWKFLEDNVGHWSCIPSPGTWVAEGKTIEPKCYFTAFNSAYGGHTLQVAVDIARKRAPQK